MHDQTIAVGHQHPFEGAVEHRRGHAQTLAILAAQLSTDADEIEQAGTGDEDQPGGEQYPDERIDLPRDRQHLGIIEKPLQHLLGHHHPEQREHQVQRGHAQGVANGNRHVGWISP